MNPPKEKDTPKEPMALEKLIDDIYGKDVVSYAYASPAGTITKGQAIADIKAWAESQKPTPPTREETGMADPIQQTIFMQGAKWAIEKTRQNIRSSK